MSPIPSNESVEQFASDLRRLRLNAGSPTLEKLQNETGISKSVLSSAFKGKQLPSARTVDAIARACDADADEWIARRDALTRPREADNTSMEPPKASAGREPRVLKRAAALWIGVGGFAGGVLTGALAFTLVLPALAPSAPAEAEPLTAEPTALVEVQNGEDPALTQCVEDAAVATGDTRADNSLLEIVWSDACQAGWGRITRYDGLSYGNTVTIAIYPRTAPDGPARQEATEHDVQGAYTTLVVRPTPDTLLCAEGSYTVDGKRIDLGDPLCI